MSDPQADLSGVPDRILPPAAYARMTTILRGGLLLSLAILVASLVAFILRHPGDSASTVIGSNPVLQYLNLPGLVTGLVQGHTEAYLTLGLLVLLATPVLRVATGFYYFEKMHDRGLSAITLTVLALILVGILVLGPLLR